MTDPTCELLNNWRQKRIPLSAVWWDKYGKKLKIEQLANWNKCKIEIDFEHNRGNRLKSNALLEVVFAMLRGIARTIMYHSNVHVKECYGVCKEANQRATPLDGAILIEIYEKRVMSYNHYALNKSPPEFLNMLRSWGEVVGVIRLISTTT